MFTHRIKELHELGLSVSYDKILQLENQLATAVCEDIVRNGKVCPVQLRKGLVTVGSLDNLNHNTSSTTAKVPHQVEDDVSPG